MQWWDQLEAIKMLFYLALHVFAVKKRLSRLMEKRSGTDVRHTWGLKVTLAFCMWDLGQLLNCSESQFYLYYGIKPVSEDYMGSHTYSANSGQHWALSSSGSFPVRGNESCNPSEFWLCLGDSAIMLLVKASGWTLWCIFIVSISGNFFVFSRNFFGFSEEMNHILFVRDPNKTLK